MVRKRKEDYIDLEDAVSSVSGVTTGGSTLRKNINVNDPVGLKNEIKVCENRI